MKTNDSIKKMRAAHEKQAEAILGIDKCLNQGGISDGRTDSIEQVLAALSPKLLCGSALSSADNDMKKAPHNVEFRRLFFGS